MIPILPGAFAGANHRRDQRHLTVLIVGKVRGAGGEYACVVRNVSRNGLKARFPCAPEVGERLVFTLRGLPDLRATVRWRDGCQAGVEFDRPIDLAAVLAQFGPARMPRAPRFACQRRTSLILDGCDLPIELIDVSLGGAKVILDPLPPGVHGHAASLVLPVLERPRAGMVRWADAGRLGFQFAAPLTLDALAAVLSKPPR